jgi:hypothetical protein
MQQWDQAQLHQQFVVAPLAAISMCDVSNGGGRKGEVWRLLGWIVAVRGPAGYKCKAEDMKQHIEILTCGSGHLF